MAVDPHVKPRLVDRPRSGTPMPPARGFVPERPGDVVAAGQPRGRLLGSPGPDLGYALVLAERFEDQLELGLLERAADAVAAGCAVAMRRCSTLGRAPTARDVEFGLSVLGYLGGAPADLVEWRRHAVHGVSHEYPELRHVVDAVRPEILALPPAEIRERLSAWRELLAADH